MQHWTMRQFNAKYNDLSSRAHRLRLRLAKGTDAQDVELCRTLAALDLMIADLYDAASGSEAIGFTLFEISAYMRAADRRRSSAEEWRTVADMREVA